MSSDVSNKTIIFFFGPCTFVCVCFFTTRRPSHLYFLFIVYYQKYCEATSRPF
ncbi:hypothetical protein HanRHA438_Chr17g0804471 [Helianthus annuus]|nr:hypothetical protein HanIR_Chr17g0861841 [Helianthus annuus]KAJ0825553.1 hypothetical protein HanRHA438_Chr17g0804471 [Helianthus annuus]